MRYIFICNKESIVNVIKFRIVISSITKCKDAKPILRPSRYPTDEKIISTNIPQISDGRNMGFVSRCWVGSTGRRACGGRPRRPGSSIPRNRRPSSINSGKAVPVFDVRSLKRGKDFGIP